MNCASKPGLCAFLDMAYQGFGRSIAGDGAVIKFVAMKLNFFVSTSFSELQPVRRARGQPVGAVRRQRKMRARAEPTQILIRATAATRPRTAVLW